MYIYSMYIWDSMEASIWYVTICRYILRIYKKSIVYILEGEMYLYNILYYVHAYVEQFMLSHTEKQP